MTGFFYGSAVYLERVKVYYIPSITQVCSSRDTVAKPTITMELLSSGVQGSPVSYTHLTLPTILLV